MEKEDNVETRNFWAMSFCIHGALKYSIAFTLRCLGTQSGNCNGIPRLVPLTYYSHITPEKTFVAESCLKHLQGGVYP